MFLQAAGGIYDQARGFKKFNVGGAEWSAVLKAFSNSCCYCGVALTDDNATRDHLVPINKKSLGLHAWGNVVPCCRQCNKEKHFGDWESFTKAKNPVRAVYKKRHDSIVAFQRKYNYNPNLKLEDIADNLYEDVGEVASALIGLRLKQAQVVINNLAANSSSTK